MKCPDCNGPLEWIESQTSYDRKVCENRCQGENSHDAHYCKLCGEIMEFEWCYECYSTCEECEKVFKGQSMWCSPECKDIYHREYKHHNEMASYMKYEESKYDHYSDLGEFADYCYESEED